MIEQLKRYAAFILIALLLAAAIFGYAKYRSYESTVADLRNQVAARDKTTEELKDTYTKLAQENSGLKSSNGDLQRLLHSTKQDLIAEQSLSVYWKGQFRYQLEHQHIPLPSGVQPPFTAPAKQEACTPVPQLYSSVKDIGLLKLTIDTFTVDPSYQQQLTVGPGSKPLQLTLDLTRDQDRQWHTHVVSSDERIGVEIGVNSVNISSLSLRWYERIKLHTDIGVGLGSGGVLAGLGIAVQFGQFELGPSVWGTTGGQEFGGLNFSWAPFQRVQ